MEAEWIWGIAAGAIASVSGMAIISKQANIRSAELHRQSMMDEFIVPFLPEVMGFYQFGVLSRNPFETVDSEKLMTAIYSKSCTSLPGPYKSSEALYHIRRLAEAAETQPKELLIFLFWYLDFANRILKHAFKQPHPLIRESATLQKQYAVWYLCYEELEADAPDSIPELLHHSAYLTDLLKEIEMGVFREIMGDEELRSDRRGNFVRIIFQALEKETAGQKELPAIRQFHEHYNCRYTHRNKARIRF